MFIHTHIFAPKRFAKANSNVLLQIYFGKSSLLSLSQTDCSPLMFFLVKSSSQDWSNDCNSLKRYPYTLSRPETHI